MHASSAIQLLSQGEEKGGMECAAASIDCAQGRQGGFVGAHMMPNKSAELTIESPVLLRFSRRREEHDPFQSPSQFLQRRKTCFCSFSKNASVHKQVRCHLFAS